MPRITAAESALLIIGLQERLLPAIHGAEALIHQADKLASAARALGVPIVVSEHCPEVMGPTVARLAQSLEAAVVLPKSSFDACADPGFHACLTANSVVVLGAEAHVCVMQTVLGLIAAGRQVHLVADALGARTAESCERAISRMAAHGADIVTTEMAIFEWLGDTQSPGFKPVLSLVK